MTLLTTSMMQRSYSCAKLGMLATRPAVAAEEGRHVTSSLAVPDGQLVSLTGGVPCSNGMLL